MVLHHGMKMVMSSRCQGATGNHINCFFNTSNLLMYRSIFILNKTNNNSSNKKNQD